MSIFAATPADATDWTTGLAASPTGAGSCRRKSKNGSSAFEKRTPFLYTRSRTAGSICRSIFWPSSSRNSPPVSACLKQTKAPRRLVRLNVDSLCIPTKNFERLGLFTASYIAPFLSTTARAPTDASGSWHGLRPSAS